MQPYARVTARCVPRVCKPAPARNVFTTPFFPHFGPAIGSEFAPLFRLLDSATADLVPSLSQRQAPRSFTPRFDVREVASSYELQGELPGIEQKDLEIEFVDERTLVIRGKTTSESITTNENEAAEPNKAIAADEAATADNVSEKSANYQKPSVEDDEYVDAGAESSGEGPKTPASPATAAADATSVAETKQAEPSPSYKYWVSERSVGEFERRFNFPGRVDQDAVRASLRNGVLSVVIPKVIAKEARRINIE